MNLGDLDLIPGTYWLEITNNPGLAPGDVWFWETGNLDPISGIDNGAFSVDLETWFALGVGSNLAFTINTSPAGGGCTNPLGDINGDGIVSLLDVSPFVALLTGGGFQCEADVNEDGIVSLLDVNPFVALLSGG